MSGRRAGPALFLRTGSGVSVMRQGDLSGPSDSMSSRIRETALCATSCAG